jgi:predicted negative regulator of RcsB-dependent stress response
MSAKKLEEKKEENQTKTSVVDWIKQYKWIIIVVVILLLIVVWWYFAKYKKKSAVTVPSSSVVDTRMSYPSMTDNFNVNVDRD